MKTIPLTQGKFALVDDEDYERVMQRKWHFMKVGYAGSNAKRDGSEGPRKMIYMHRFILDVPKGYESDHVNRNKLDNRRQNLRIATRQQNACNQGKRVDNTSGYKGVSWAKKDKKWQVHAHINGKYIFLGNYDDKHVAYSAYKNAVRLHHGEFAGV